MNMKIQYHNKIRWGLAPLTPNDAPPLDENIGSCTLHSTLITVLLFFTFITLAAFYLLDTFFDSHV
jgi:hypothetical protein